MTAGSTHGPLRTISRLARSALRRPLSEGELIAMIAATLLVGTLYCAAYCRIAFSPMHHGTMPLWKSLWWATTALLPWLLMFEAMKRVLPRFSRRRHKVLVFALATSITALLLFSAARMTDFGLAGMMSKDWRILAANQLQPALIFMILTGLWALEAAPAAQDVSVNLAASPDFPALHSIDWIRAAGNYVELSCAGRLLIRRMTMRAAEEATRGGKFVRIHRSIIVRAELISGFVDNDRGRLRLLDGAVLPVGDSYRTTVERLVTRSLPFGTSAHLTS